MNDHPMISSDTAQSRVAAPPPCSAAERAEILSELDALTIVQIRNRTDQSRPPIQRLHAGSSPSAKGGYCGWLCDNFGDGRLFLRAEGFEMAHEAKAHMEKVMEACK
jgi:hypothetical protein